MLYVEAIRHAKAMLRWAEGLRLTAYRDTGGVLTIGYGHTGKDVTDVMVIDEDRAEQLLDEDLKRAVRDVEACTVDGTGRTACRLYAMACLTFNVGIGNFKKSSVRRLFNAGDYEGARAAFALWNKIRGTDGVLRVSNHQNKRRADEALLFNDREPKNATY